MLRVERLRFLSSSAIHKELSYSIFPCVERFRNGYVTMVRYMLTGRASPADVCGAALAKYQCMSPYAGFKAESVSKLDSQPLRL